MPHEITTSQLNEISKAIESAYQEFKSLIDKLADINGIVESFKSSSQAISEQYKEALDDTKLKKVQNDHAHTIKDMEKSLSGIQDRMVEIQTIKKVAEDQMKIVIRRIQNFEKLLEDLNTKAKNLDKKLTQSMESLKLRHGNVEKKADKALRLMELNYQVEKYDEILQLQKKNNILLKNLVESSKNEK